MKTITKSMRMQASAVAVFDAIDDLGVTGMHMTKSSGMMMGSKLHLQYLTENHTGLNSMYKWTGKMMGMNMDFTVRVTRWLKGIEKIWETVGEAKMIIYSWYRMHLIISEYHDHTLAKLSISYEKPNGWLAKVISFLFADMYCRWCLKSMLEDAKRMLEGHYELSDSK